MKDEEFKDPFLSAHPYRIPDMPERIKSVHQPKALRVVANVVSVLFHPLFVPAYIVTFLLYVHPYSFSGFSPELRLLRLISIVLLTAFFPAFSVFLLKKLGFIQSIYLKTQKERIIPYIISNFFFFWVFYVSKNLPGSPPVFVTLLLGIFISSIAAIMANIYFKVSMHAIAMGGMISFFILLAMEGNFSMGIYLSVAMLIAGIVCTARLIVSDHYPFEIYAGLFLGIISQAIAVAFQT